VDLLHILLRTSSIGLNVKMCTCVYSTVNG